MTIDTPGRVPLPIPPDGDSVWSVWWRAVAQPAFQGGGGFHSSAPVRIWLHAVTMLVEQTLHRLLDRPVVVRVTDTRQPGTASRCFSVAAVVGASEAALSIHLSHHAARLIADAFAQKTTGLRSTGPLSDVECGVLEYVSLECAEAIATGLCDRSGMFRLSNLGFSDGALDSEEGVHLDLHIGAQAGEIALHGPALKLDTGTPVPNSVAVSSESCSGSDSVEVRVALPPFRVSRLEWEAIERGDVLLTGCRELTAWPGPSALVTASGWCLCPAQILADSPTMIQVQCGSLRPEVELPASPRDQSVSLRVLSGLARFGYERFCDLRSGMLLDLPKEDEPPLRIWQGCREVGRGEWVRVGGELGVRFLGS